MSVIENLQRVGRFTSSQKYKLMTNGNQKHGVGKPFITFVNEKRMERKLGRSLDLGKGNSSTAWGGLIELFLFQEHREFKENFEYSLQSKTTFVHPKHEYWAGSPDLIVSGENTADRVAEVKCYEPKKFCQYADVLMLKDVEVFKKEFPQEYWQIVSNACILGLNYGEAILYMPYRKDLNAIREWIETTELADEMHRFRYISELDDHRLPYVPENSKYKDLVRFEFEVPEADKEALTDRVKLAESECNYPLERKVN